MGSVFEGSHFSRTLLIETGLSVILPSELPESGRCPVLYLLHGLGDNHRSWLLRTNIARYADEAGIAVIMPSAQHSFYTDMAGGMRYYTYLTQELPAYVRRTFPVTDDPAQTYIAGLSMGGYGALKIALKNPDAYGAVASFSGCVDIRDTAKKQHLLPEEEVLGIFGREPDGEEDVLLLLSKAAKSHTALPPIYLTCGLSDFLYEQNQRLRRQLDFLRVPYTYDEWPGAHEWNFWDRSVRHFIQFLGK